jgi:hypothetical protein
MVLLADARVEHVAAGVDYLVVKPFALGARTIKAT